MNYLIFTSIYELFNRFVKICLSFIMRLNLLEIITFTVSLNAFLKPHFFDGKT